MRNVFFAVLVLAASAGAQSREEKAGTTSAPSNLQSLSPQQAEVWKQEQNLHSLEYKRDFKSYMSVWDVNFAGWPDYVQRPLGKAGIESGVTEEFKSEPAPRGPFIAPEPEAVAVFGDVGITHYFWPDADTASRTVYRTTHTWKKSADGWHIIGGMSCQVPRVPVAHVNIPIVPAMAGDVTSPEAVVRASFESESGAAGTPRQWARERALYDPDTVAVAAGPEAGNGNLKPRRWVTFQPYADELDAYEVKAGFVDRPLGCVTNKRAYVATVTCGYEASENGKVVERGVDMFQLYNDGKRWWILSVVWDRESPDNPIPKELLAQQ